MLLPIGGSWWYFPDSSYGSGYGYSTSNKPVPRKMTAKEIDARIEELVAADLADYAREPYQMGIPTHEELVAYYRAKFK